MYFIIAKFFKNNLNSLRKSEENYDNEYIKKFIMKQILEQLEQMCRFQ